jgi:ribosomal protein L27
MPHRKRTVGSRKNSGPHGVESERIGLEIGDGGAVRPGDVITDIGHV